MQTIGRQVNEGPFRHVRVLMSAGCKHLRAMQAGERLIIYETGDVKSAVGTASVVSADASDAKNPRVKIKVGRSLTKPVTLAEIKANRLFVDSPLVRQGRLSVVPLSEEQHRFLVAG